jgi:hypothetical protein
VDVVGAVFDGIVFDVLEAVFDATNCFAASCAAND